MAKSAYRFSPTILCGVWPAVGAALVLMAIGGCSQDPPVTVMAGDPSQGKELIREVGCGSCHIIPGIESAQGEVGPPLDKIARRAYLGGVLPNTFHDMVLWLQHPQKVAPGSAMPPTGLSQAEAEHIAAYLFTLD